jgi:phenylpropionate dioxygenase-like ring-hydroxylating dioxygenase large terminal subunit
MDGVDGFDKQACRLPELRSELWEGWIFVNFDPDAAPLAPQLAPLSKRLAEYDMAEMVSVHTATYDSAFNWKVLTDNFMEAYHHIATHADTLQPLFPAASSHTPDNEGPYSVLYMPTGDEAAAHAEAEGIETLVAATVFPLHLFAPTRDAMAWYQILPRSFDRFTLHIYSCFPRAVVEDEAQRATVEGMQALTRTIHEQDIGACEAVWAGLLSGSFESGRLSLLEKPIWQFNRWWSERMVDGASR